MTTTEHPLSRNDAVNPGSEGRQPAVFGGPPNISWVKLRGIHWFQLKSEPGSRRRAGDDCTRAARAPHSRTGRRVI
jgi:hypothetical protein